MDKAQALAALRSGNARERLLAARFLRDIAGPEDRVPLRAASEAESVTWVRAALADALLTSRVASLSEARESPGQSADDASDRDILARAVEETSGRIVHELAPIIGAARYHASEEIPNFETSRTAVALDRLKQLLDALDRLSRAARPPLLEEFDLAALIRRAATDEEASSEATLELVGREPFVVIGDQWLVDLVLRNGMRNALEASRPGQTVVGTWGETDRDYWLTLLDSGPGPPASPADAFEMGRTTKADHSGMGLTLARQAVDSLQGKLTLEERADGGASFAFRWPKQGTEPG